MGELSRSREDEAFCSFDLSRQVEKTLGGIVEAVVEVCRRVQGEEGWELEGDGGSEGGMVDDREGNRRRAGRLRAQSVAVVSR